MDRSGNYEQFEEAVQQAAALMRTYAGSSCTLLHHNDADGLSSGAILVSTLERLRIRVNRYCLEKPYPKVISRIMEGREDPIVIVADFGSGVGELWSAYAKPERVFLLVDHHQIAGLPAKHVTLCNPLQYGLGRESDCSASTVCAQVALALSADNADLAWMGVVGWLGDRYLDVGLNRAVAEVALRSGMVSRNEGGAFVFRGRPLTSIASMLNAVGAYGYLDGGPDFGIKSLLSGDMDALAHFANRFEERYRASLKTFTAESLAKAENGVVRFFRVGEEFLNFGVKTVGLLCEHAIDEGWVESESYVLGFQRIPAAIPGLGDIPLHEVKLSMRISPSLWTRVKAGEMPDLTYLVPAATRPLGGLIDACHPHAAASTIPDGSEDAFLHHLGAALKEWSRED